MNETPPATRSVVVERQLAHPPEKVWRALTQPALIADWLMQNDFQPQEGHAFTLRADWGSVACKVLEVQPHRSLAYSWSAFGLESVVTWTLTPSASGTHLRMEQSGFPADRPQFYQGAEAGWPGFLDGLEKVLARID
jgi:uncharacterized protein YndB with AHSA1/START domain